MQHRQADLPPHHQHRGFQMTSSAALIAVRKRHFGLDALPDAIVIPALGPRRDAEVKAVEEATLDDLAFTVQGLEAEFNAVGDRLHSLRKLYGLARRAGALGAERAVDAITSDKGGR